MAEVLVRYTLAQPGGTEQSYVIERLDESNVDELAPIVPITSLSDKKAFLSVRQNWAVCFRVDSGRMPIYINVIEAVVRYWTCRRNRRLLKEWDPQVDYLRRTTS